MFDEAVERFQDTLILPDNYPLLYNKMRAQGAGQKDASEYNRIITRYKSDVRQRKDKNYWNQIELLVDSKLLRDSVLENKEEY